MDAHPFTPTAGAKSPCTVCGKTRSAKAHRPVEVAPPADDKTVSTWVGRKLSELAEGDKVVGAKFKAATPTKAGDRTVRLTRAESDALAAIATEVENQGGMMALSGRTLRARLDAAWNA